MSEATSVVSMLSDELWLKILSYLLPADCLEPHFWSLTVLAKNQKELYLLRRVCSRFNHLFLDFPVLSRSLVLDWRDPSRPIPAHSLLAWLRRFSCSVEDLKLRCGAPILQMVFGALVTQPQRLRSLTLGRFDESDLISVSLFTSLTRLALSELDPSDSFDIGALQVLPQLKELVLHLGEFCTPTLPSGLVTLQLEEADLQLARSANGPAPLRRLEMRSSEFSTSHSTGLLAYTTLEELRIHHGCISADYASDSATFGDSYHRPFSCPDLSLLKCLKTLYLEVGGSFADDVIDWGCLYCLPALQALTLHNTGQDLNIGQNLTMLVTLVSLSLIGAAPDYSHDPTYSHLETVVSVAIDVNWRAMPCLQSLYIRSDVLTLGPHMSSLVGAPVLKHVNIVDSRRVSAQAPQSLAALISSIVVQRPDVTFVLNGKHMLVKNV